MNKFYRNNKTGRIYKVVREAINTTNKDDGARMIIYIGLYKESANLVFVREKSEFEEKFTKIEVSEVEPNCVSCIHWRMTDPDNDGYIECSCELHGNYHIYQATPKLVFPNKLCINNESYKRNLK